MPSRPTPRVQALLLADHIYQDRATGKCVICGVFSELYYGSPSVETGPTGQPTHIDVSLDRGFSTGSPWAYISLTELNGDYRFELRYVDLAENAVLLQLVFGVGTFDPLKTVEIVIPLPPLPLPLKAPEDQRERSCALELLCDDELISSHRVAIKPIEKKGDA
jgi:hypothetical protein